MTRRLALGFVSLSFFLAACTGEGLPVSFADQDGRAQTQFVSACEASLDGADSPGAGFCQCAFYTVASELTFEEFLELDEQLREDPGALSLEDRQLLESISLPCQFSAEDINNG